MTERLAWDDFFILLATLYSSRGTCDRLRTACIVVKNNRIVGAGYNGSVSGIQSCDEVGHLMVEGHCLRTIHGENNAINNSVADLEGATAYVVATPCFDCVKNLLQNGIKRIVCVGSYANSKGKPEAEVLCELKGVELRQISDDPRYVIDLLAKALSRLREPGGIFQKLLSRGDWEGLLPEDESFVV
jgi:dCMP deaminase